MRIVPGHWDRGRLKWDVCLTAGGTPTSDDGDYWLAGDDPAGVPFVSISDMSRREHVSATLRSLSTDGLSSRNMPVGAPGTLLLAMYASVGEVAFLEVKATWSQALLGLTPLRHEVEPRFLRYVLLDMREDLLRDARTNTQANLNAGQVGDIWFQKPPYEEQRAIADYLDHETVRIDELITQQQRLIDLLGERRDAVVSHAVLESTPARTGLRRVAEVIDCAHVTAEFVDDDQRFPVASIRECQGPTVDLRNCNYTTEAFFDLLRASGRAPRAGDLLFVRNVSVGLVSIVTPGTQRLALGQETVLLRRSVGMDPAFLRYALTAAEARHAVEAAMVGSTFRRINVSAIRALPVPAPPLPVQQRVAAYLDAQIGKIDALATEARHLIDLAQERRAALITAAVTGQIDVREVA